LRAQRLRSCVPRRPPPDTHRADSGKDVDVERRILRLRAMNPFERFAVELGKLAVVASLEPVKESFRTRPGQVGAITRTLRALGHDEVRDFSSPKGRDDFLWATANYLESLNHEELIVAFGSRRGRDRSAAACLRRVHRTVGTESSVAVTTKLLRLLDEYLAREGAEVALVHNHPSNLLKTVVRHTIGWRPIASRQDRNLALSFWRSRVGHFLTATRPSSFKWFLLDEGELAEFPLPTMDTLLAWATQVQQR